jgi:DNA-directed RNA polymerase specialized sigma24 family protein
MARSLSTDQRQARDAYIRELHDLEKLSEREIARRTGWSRSTVWASLQRTKAVA